MLASVAEVVVGLAAVAAAAGQARQRLRKARAPSVRVDQVVSEWTTRLGGELEEEGVVAWMERRVDGGGNPHEPGRTAGRPVLGPPSATATAGPAPAWFVHGATRRFIHSHT